jgi:hypothetical protein
MHAASIVENIHTAQIIQFSQYARHARHENTQFSQVTRHAVPLRKSSKSPTSPVFHVHADRANVTLTSKATEACRALEKIPYPCPEGIAQTVSDLSAFERDLETLTATALSKRYPKEYRSWSNFKCRSKAKGVPVHPDFEDFRSFLRIVKPKPAHGATLDRVDNSNPMYGPGLVAWADKRTQNNNRSCTITIRDSRTNEVYTAQGLLGCRVFLPPRFGSVVSGDGHMMKL